MYVADGAKEVVLVYWRTKRYGIPFYYEKQDAYHSIEPPSRRECTDPHLQKNVTVGSPTISRARELTDDGHAGKVASGAQSRKFTRVADYLGIIESDEG